MMRLGTEEYIKSENEKFRINLTKLSTDESKKLNNILNQEKNRLRLSVLPKELISQLSNHICPYNIDLITIDSKALLYEMTIIGEGFVINLEVTPLQFLYEKNNTNNTDIEAVNLFLIDALNPGEYNTSRFILNEDPHIEISTGLDPIDKSAKISIYVRDVNIGRVSLCAKFFEALYDLALMVFIPEKDRK